MKLHDCKLNSYSTFTGKVHNNECQIQICYTAIFIACIEESCWAPVDWSWHKEYCRQGMNARTFSQNPCTREKSPHIIISICKNFNEKMSVSSPCYKFNSYNTSLCNVYNSECRFHFPIKTFTKDFSSKPLAVSNSLMVVCDASTLLSRWWNCCSRWRCKARMSGMWYRARKWWLWQTYAQIQEDIMECNFLKLYAAVDSRTMIQEQFFFF